MTAGPATVEELSLEGCGGWNEFGRVVGGKVDVIGDNGTERGD